MHNTQLVELLGGSKYEYNVFDMKDIKSLFDGVSTYQRPTEVIRHESNYAYWVDLTAKMLKRPYIQVHSLVKDWPEHKIERRYKLAQDAKNPAAYWWWARKEETKK